MRGNDRRAGMGSGPEVAGGEPRRYDLARGGGEGLTSAFDRPLNRTRRNERAIEKDILEHVARERPLAVEFRRRAIAEMRVVGVFARRIARNRQESDALFRNGDPFLLAGQEFERAAALAIDGRRAIVAAAAKLAVLAVNAGIDVMRRGRRRGSRQRRKEDAAKGDANQSFRHRQPLLLAADRSKRRQAMRSSRALIAFRRRRVPPEIAARR